MAKIYSAVAFKASKIFINDLSKVIVAVDTAIKGIEAYSRYQLVNTLLNTRGGLREALIQAEAYKGLYEEELKKKGVINE